MYYRTITQRRDVRYIFTEPLQMNNTKNRLKIPEGTPTCMKKKRLADCSHMNRDNLLKKSTSEFNKYTVKKNHKYTAHLFL